MATILRSHGLALEGGVLTKPYGTCENWNSNVLLNVPDPTRFTVSVQPLEPSERQRDTHVGVYLIGIAPRDCKLIPNNEETLELFVNVVGNKYGVQLFPWSLPKLGRRVDESFVATRVSEISPGQPSLKGRVEMTFMDNALYLSWEGRPRLKLVDEIPKGDYRPCISIGTPGERLRVFVGSVGRKRACEFDGLEVVETAKRLWSNRAFTDATVACTTATGDKKQIPVHRCVLSAASPFFERAFQGDMREAKEASITISDASEDSVEAFVRYLYTGEVSETFAHAKLLPLAHRYECDKLLELTAANLLETLSEQNCAEYVGIMQPFEEDPKLAAYWTKLADRIGCDPVLARALMRGSHSRKRGD